MCVRDGRTHAETAGNGNGVLPPTPPGREDAAQGGGNGERQLEIMADNVVSIIIKANGASANAELKGVGASVDRLGVQMARVSRAIDVQQAKYSGLEMAQGKWAASNRALLASGAAVAGGLGLLAKSAMAPEQELRNVNTIAKLNENQLGQLRGEIARVSGEHLVLADRLQVTQGVYDVMSVKGFKASDAIGIVGKAAVLATAGHEQLQGAIESTMDIMTTYGRKTPEEAQKVTDELYQAVQIGRFRLADLTGEIGPAMSVSSQMGVDEKEVLAALAVMTNKGFAVSEAATGIERTMTAALKPSKEFTAVANKMGYESTAAMVRAEGLAGALRLVEQATGGDEMALAAIDPNVRALRAAMALGGESAKDFADAQRDLANASGAAAAAAKIQMGGPDDQFQWMLIQLKSAGQDLGREAIPDLLKLTKAITGLVHDFNKLSPEQKKHIVQTAEWTAGLLLAGGALGTVANGLLSVFLRGSQALGVIRALKAGAAAKTAAGAGGAGSAVADAASVAGDVIDAVGKTKGKGKAAAEVAGGAATDTAAGADAAAGIRGWFARRQAAKTAATVATEAAGGAGNVEAEVVGLADMFTTSRERGFARAAKIADLQLKQPSGVADLMDNVVTGMEHKGFGAPKLSNAAWREGFEVFKVERAAIASEEKGLAMVLRTGARDVGGSLKSLPGTLLGMLKGIGGLGGATTSGTIVAGEVAAGAEGAAAAGGAGALGAAATAAALPVAAVGLALAGLAVEGHYLVNSWRTTRAALDEDTRKKSETKQVVTDAAKQGTWTFDSVARGMGYTDKQIEQLNNRDSSDPEFKRISDEVRRRNARNAVGKSAAHRQLVEQQRQAGLVAADAEINARQMANMQAGRNPWDNGGAAPQLSVADAQGAKLPQMPTGRPGTQGYAGAGALPVATPKMAAAYGSPSVSVARGQGGGTFSFTGYFNDVNEMKAQFNRLMDQQLGYVQG